MSTSIKELLDIQAAIECGFTLKRINRFNNSQLKKAIIAQFEHICEREDVNKCFSLNREDFQNLKKTALSILETIDILQMLVDKVEGTNQLIETSMIYSFSELYMIESKGLAYFNHYVTFPLLNCGETSLQHNLLK